MQEWQPGAAGRSSADAGAEAATGLLSAATRTLRRPTGKPRAGIRVATEPRVNREYRLTSGTDFKRVRRTGKSYAHPLVFLIASPNRERHSRFGVTVGRSLGSAVKRNRAKRRLREALRRLQADVLPGWDLILVARTGLVEAPWPQLLKAIEGLFRKANLIRATE